MPHSSTKGRFLEKCLKSDKVRTAAGFVERGRNLIAWSAAIISLVRTLRGRRKK